MPVDLDDNIFMIPGPVKMHPRVLRAMARPAFAHRSPEFRTVNKELRELLQYTFQTAGEVALLSGSGTAGVDSAFSNLFHRTDKVVCLNNGKFGERLAELARVYASPVVIDAPWGQPVDLERVREAAAGAKALSFVHNETSTGFTNPAEDIIRIAHDQGCLVILDGITSIGGLDVPMDRWKLDVAIFGSQKCVAAPAGLAAVAVSERVKGMLHDDNAYYLNLRKHLAKFNEGDTPFTPAIPLFFALLEALRMLKEEGLANRIQRTRALAEGCRRGAKAIGLELFPDPAFASNTLTALRYPFSVDDAKFRNALKEKHRVIVAGAQDQIKGKVWRIGHMGITSFTDLAATFAAVEAELAGQGHKFDHGASVAALEPWMA